MGRILAAEVLGFVVLVLGLLTWDVVALFAACLSFAASPTTRAVVFEERESHSLEILAADPGLTGDAQNVMWKDNWTATTRDNKRSAQ